MVAAREPCIWWQHLDVADEEWEEAVELCRTVGSADCVLLLDLARMLTTYGVPRGREIWALTQEGTPEEWAAAHSDR